MSCKYYYRGGLCANSQMEKPFCVGEDKCEFLSGKISAGTEPGRVSAKREVQFTTQVFKEEKKEDSMSQWMGVYCPHYQRFFCTGGTDGCKSGCCATATDYERSLAEHMEKLK